jgi:hypothetical protein
MSFVRPLVIAALVLTEVGLWQWRMVIAAGGSHLRDRSDLQQGTEGAGTRHACTATWRASSRKPSGALTCAPPRPNSPNSASDESTNMKGIQ